ARGLEDVALIDPEQFLAILVADFEQLPGQRQALVGDQFLLLALAVLEGLGLCLRKAIERLPRPPRGEQVLPDGGPVLVGPEPLFADFPREEGPGVPLLVRSVLKQVAPEGVADVGDPDLEGGILVE